MFYVFYKTEENISRAKYLTEHRTNFLKNSWPNNNGQVHVECESAVNL